MNLLVWRSGRLSPSVKARTSSTCNILQDSPRAICRGISPSWRRQVSSPARKTSLARHRARVCASARRGAEPLSSIGRNWKNSAQAHKRGGLKVDGKPLARTGAAPFFGELNFYVSVPQKNGANPRLNGDEGDYQEPVLLMTRTDSDCETHGLTV